MNKKYVEITKNESGVALVIALVMMTVLTLIGLAASFTSTFEIMLSGEKGDQPMHSILLIAGLM